MDYKYLTKILLVLNGQKSMLYRHVLANVPELQSNFYEGSVTYLISHGYIKTLETSGGVFISITPKGKLAIHNGGLTESNQTVQQIQSQPTTLPTVDSKPKETKTIIYITLGVSIVALILSIIAIVKK